MVKKKKSKKNWKAELIEGTYSMGIGMQMLSIIIILFTASIAYMGFSLIGTLASNFEIYMVLSMSILMAIITLMFYIRLKGLWLVSGSLVLWGSLLNNGYIGLIGIGMFLALALYSALFATNRFFSR